MLVKYVLISSTRELFQWITRLCFWTPGLIMISEGIWTVVSWVQRICSSTFALQFRLTLLWFYMDLLGWITRFIICTLISSWLVEVPQLQCHEYKGYIHLLLCYNLDWLFFGSPWKSRAFILYQFLQFTWQLVWANINLMFLPLQLLDPVSFHVRAHSSSIPDHFCGGERQNHMVGSTISNNCLHSGPPDLYIWSRAKKMVKPSRR